MSNGNQDHHVAWADRIGLNKAWSKAIENIRVSYGSSYFEDAVWSFHTIIINIRGGPQLKNEVDEYIRGGWTEKINNRLKDWVNNHPYESNDVSNVELERNIIMRNLLPDLANFMIQLLENYGFGFYESNIEEDEMA